MMAETAPHILALGMENSVRVAPSWVSWVITWRRAASVSGWTLVKK